MCPYDEESRFLQVVQTIKKKELYFHFAYHFFFEWLLNLQSWCSQLVLTCQGTDDFGEDIKEVAQTYKNLIPN